MNLLTLAQARSDLWKYGSLVPFAGASAADTADFDAKLNMVLENLLLNAKPRHTTRRVLLPIYSKIITLPRGLLSCIGIKLVPVATTPTDYQVLRIYGNLHEFHNSAIPEFACTGAVYPTNQLAQTFLTPTANFTLRIKATEAGGNITLIGGTDTSGNEYFDSVTLAVTNGTTTTTRAYNTLPQIQKPETVNSVSLYSVNSGTETLIAIYAPGETVPAYTQYTVSNPANSPYCFALCNIAFVKVVADNDIVYPGVSNALRFGLKALNREDAEQPDAGNLWWSKAQDALDKDRQKLDGETQSEFYVERGISFGDMPATI